MNDIVDILNQLCLTSDSKNIIEKLGKIRKNVGDSYFLTPYNDRIDAISLTLKGENILSVGVTLKKSVEFESLKKDISVEYSCLYNHYDEETVINFIFTNGLLLSCIIDGYIEIDNLESISISRYKITFPSSPSR